MTEPPYRSARPWSRACLHPWELHPLEHGIHELRDRSRRTVAHFVAGAERAAHLAQIAPLLAAAIRATRKVARLRAAPVPDEILLAEAEDRARVLMEQAEEQLAAIDFPRATPAGLEEAEARAYRDGRAAVREVFASHNGRHQHGVV